MTWKPRSRSCVFALISALGCAAACGDEGGATPATMTDSNQPSGIAGGGAGSGGGAPAGGGASGMPGTSGANGAGEAPGVGAVIGTGAGIDMGAGGTAMGAEGTASTGSAAGSAGMAPASTDTDGDGVADDVDACAQDPNKLAAGTCGCGVLDTDIDFDGALDCQETCPADPGKTAPGLCGCGAADVDTDTDGTLDCEDDCPFDDAHVALGACGCGAPDTLPLCLRHRYSFEGAGDVATDSAGDADGAIIGTTLAGDGTLLLAGGVSDQYVNLPARIISTLGRDATLEAWVTWTGAGAPWQRIFDFGSSDQPAGQQGPNGATYLFLTPSNTINTDLRLAYTNAGPPAERVVNGPTPLPFMVAVHLAVVVDGAAQTLTLYQNGALIGTAPTLDTTLAALNDVNNWLGRSQFVADEEFQGELDEVRIYSVARSAAQIAADADSGPDELPEQ